MLGRHVYRVHPAEGRWTVTKEGESQPRGAFAGREEALAEACGWPKPTSRARSRSTMATG